MISRDCGTEGPKIVTDCPQHGAKRGEVQTPRDRLARPRHRQLKTAPILDRGGVGQVKKSGLAVSFFEPFFQPMDRIITRNHVRVAKQLIE